LRKPLGRIGKGASAQLTGGDNGLTYRLLQNFIAPLPATRLATQGNSGEVIAFAMRASAS
jgi:hypothetical protein